MEQAQYLTVMMNKKHILNSQFQAPPGGGFLSSNSWEEQAFAEDAAGVLGGCVWPPRSYSCSFCRREFKSAQALGGHMNIHRRDRAKLKQTLGPHNDETDHQVSPPGPAFVSSSLSPSAVYNDQHSSFVVSSLLQGHRNRNGTTSSPPAITWSDPLAVTTLLPPTSVVSDSDSKAELQKHRTKQEETHLSVSLNSVTRRNRSSSDEEEEEEQEETVLGSKRPKTVVFSVSLPFFLNPCSQQSWSQPEARGPKPTSMEDTIDLELRLGHMPKVK